uniref:Predicted protein n=1 Tax=Physcomitrium patens TaxID=3218 RepID=A9U5L1_PHYPA
MEAMSHYTRKHWARATTEVLVKDNLILRQCGWKQKYLMMALLMQGCLYSSSQKLIDCLTIGESPYYLLQPDARNSKAMIERKLWQPKHCKQWSIKFINLMEGIFQATIQGRTGWEDPVESLSVHAYIAKSQHEALMEEKRRGNFDDTREGNSSKRQTRGDKTREATSQELPTKDKGKTIAYKLLSHIEAATTLKGVLKERILNAKVEFTLKEVLGIAKKEFHDVIIDSIKRKRQLMGETGMSHAIDARIYKDEEEVDIGYKQSTNEKNEYNQ